MIRTKAHLKDLYRTSQQSRKGYLRLDMNEGLPGLPDDFIRKALLGLTADFLSTYPEYNELRQRIAQHNNLKPHNICLSNGSDGAIKYIFDAYMSAKDRVLMTNPTFAMYPVYCRMFDAEAIVTEYRDDLSFPEDDFKRLISREIKMAIIVNPNNPTGSVVKQKTLDQIIAKAAAENVILVVDEAYFYFYPESVIGKVKEYENLVVLRTFSKLCSMAAIRLGYAAACPEIIENLSRVKPTFDVNGLAVLLATEALENEGVIQSLIGRAKDGKAYLVKKLSEEKIGYIEGHANFVLIECGDRVAKIVDGLAKQKILVKGGFRQNFLKDYVRVTIGDKLIMQRFWEIFLKIWRAGIK